MITEKDLEELNQYSKVMCFSLDDARRNIKAKDRRLFDFLTDSFYKDIYHERSWAETELKRFILDNNRVLSVEGIAGCGKSTIIRKVLNTLRDQNRYPSYILDFNILSNNDHFKAATDYSSFSIALSSVVRNELLSTYFTSSEDALEALYDHALFSDDALTRSDFVDERLELSLMAGRNIPNADLVGQREWLRVHRNDERIHRLRNTILSKIRYTHLFVILRDILPYDDRFILIFDNVDRLQKQIQPYCYDFAISCNHEMYEFAKIVIAIRPENAHVPAEVTGQRSEDVDSLLLVDLGVQDYLNSYLDSEGFHKILIARQKAYSNYYKDTRIISRLDTLTQILKNEYAEIILIDVANQSIRVALDYHCKFLKYLLTTCPFDDLNELVKRGHHRSLLLSCLLGWIAECGEVVSDLNLNVAKMVREAERCKYRSRGCDLSYLILVCLLKQTINPWGEEIYRVSFRALANRLSILGYTMSEVQQQVYQLYFNKNREFGHVISISNDEIVRNQESISLATRISLNYRGKKLVETVGIMFFFINRLLNRTKGKDLGEYKGTFGYYDYSNYAKHARSNILLFARVARLHCIELVRIAVKLGGDDWLTKYMDQFAIPYYSDGSAKLQLSRILECNKKFMESAEQQINFMGYESVRKAIETIDVLEKLYDQFVETITPKTVFIYDWDRIVNECLEDKCPRTPSQFRNDNYMVNASDLIHIDLVAPDGK